MAFTVLVLALIAFGGYVAPMAEVKLGLGCGRVPLLSSTAHLQARLWLRR